MPRVCVYPRCFNRMKINSPVMFHRLPLGNPEMLQLWLTAMSLEITTTNLRSRSLRVCSEHFSADDYVDVTFPGGDKPTKRLKPTAVPSACLVFGSGLNAGAMKPVETTDDACPFDDLNRSTYYSEKSTHTLTSSQAGSGGTKLKSRMCSVVGCDSWRRSAQRFKLPEDPERRLEWVQFILEVNGQRLKESSWTDITICLEHFTHDSFEHTSGTVQLKPSAVPSVCVKSERDEPLESPQYVEPVETTDAACPFYDLNHPTSCSEKSTLTGSQASPVSSGVSMSNSPDATFQKKVTNIDLNKEKAALLQMKGKYAVNENCLLQLFRRKCPSCGRKLLMEKVTYGVLVVLNQQCLQCDYRFQWKSQVNASVPKVEDQHFTGGTEVTPETQQEVPTDDKPSSTVCSEIVTFSDEDSDPSDEGEEGDEGGVSSDGEWNPTEGILLTEELIMDSEEESEDENAEEEDIDSPGGLKINELCTECGSFFNIQKPHTCEHKIKPYSCNICGKRCVTETSLKNHSKIHDETYEHPCKYCHVTFRTRADKLKHEQIHQDCKDPYKCPDCPETFATSKERSIHLTNHRTGPKVYKCGVCGIEFKDVHHLRRHSVVHTGLKPYKCSVCQRGFNQTSHLKSHMRLHTGERPYKCQHCDKSFNHNVSLKSHVQRYHSLNSGSKRKKVKIEKSASDSGDAEDSGNKKGTDSEFDSVEGEVQKERTDVQKSAQRRTGRPRGRPKRNAAGSLVPAGQKEGQHSNAKTTKSKAQKLKKTGSSDEESEDEQSDSDMSYDSAEEEEEQEEEEEEEKETVRKSTGRSRGRPKNDSDTDFDPEEETKRKKYNSQSSGKSSGKRRGRPKKNLVV